MALVTDKDIRRTRIRVDPVGRRDRVIVIVKSRHLRRLAVFPEWGCYETRFGAVPNHPIPERSPAPPEVIEPLAARQFPPMPEMKQAAAGDEIGHRQPIDDPGNFADWCAIQKREERDSLAKAMKLSGHFESNQSAHRASCQIERSIALEREDFLIVVGSHVFDRLVSCPTPRSPRARARGRAFIPP